MAQNITKQEVKSLLDTAISRMTANIVTRQELKGTVDHARDRMLSTLVGVQRDFNRQISQRTVIHQRYSMSLDIRFKVMERELMALRQDMSRLLHEVHAVHSAAS